MSSRPLMRSSATAPENLAEVRFRARMARVGPALAGQTNDRGHPGLRLGRTGSLAIAGLVAVLVVAGAVAWPSVQVCRQQQSAGQSVGACIRQDVQQGLADHLDKADQTFKGLLRAVTS